MIEWKILVDRKPTGPRAPCELCLKMIPATQPRSKIWNEMMKATGGKNGPGLWTHPECADEMIEAVRIVDEESRLFDYE